MAMGRSSNCEFRMSMEFERLGMAEDIDDGVLVVLREERRMSASSCFVELDSPS